MFKYQMLTVLEILVLVLGVVQGRLKEVGNCDFKDEARPEFQCRKSCRGVIESPVGTCDDGLKCCYLAKPVVRPEVPEHGYCLLDTVVDEQFECKQSCGDFVEIPVGKCATGLKCCFTISPNYGIDFTTAPDVLIKKVTIFSERMINGFVYQ